MSWVLHEGDCLEVMPTLPDHSVDMILCDLPYGTTQNGWDSVISLDQLWKNYRRLIKLNGAIVLTAQPPFDKSLATSNMGWFRYEWIWVKQKGTGHLNANKMPLKNHENILVFYQQLPTYNPQFEHGKPYDKGQQHVKSANYGIQKGATYVNPDGKRYPKSVLYFNTVERGQHPTEKPVDLFEYLLRTYTNPDDTVMDNCAGSGTTGVAAAQCGRNSIMIEREPKYCDIIRQRMAGVAHG